MQLSVISILLLKDIVIVWHENNGRKEHSKKDRLKDLPLWNASGTGGGFGATYPNGQTDSDHESMM